MCTALLGMGKSPVWVTEPQRKMAAILAEKVVREPGHASSALGWGPLAIYLPAMDEEKSSLSMGWESQTWVTVQVMRF